ncbi:MAG: SCO family protein [Burkholderiaceae bacterium]|nr:SCO family protein [Burkholderiaceae bacterium]
MKSTNGVLALCGCCLLFASAVARADDPQSDPHAHHHHMMQGAASVTRTATNYAVPDITLVRSDGTRVNLVQDLKGDPRPVLLDFIYTTCTTICPVLTQTFAEVQRRLGADAAKVKMVSVSIDPEEDTPARLTEYAKRYQAGPQWEFLTGTLEASVGVQRAFDVYRGDKMSHSPVTLYRAAPGGPWIRLDGFATPDALLDEVHQQVAQFSQGGAQTR